MRPRDDLLFIEYFLQKKNTVRFVMKKPDAWMLVQSCQLGVPAFIGEISSGITTALFNFLILGLVGNVGVAAYGVIANLSLIFICIFDGIAQGAITSYTFENISSDHTVIATFVSNGSGTTTIPVTTAHFPLPRRMLSLKFLSVRRIQAMKHSSSLWRT